MTGLKTPKTAALAAAGGGVVSEPVRPGEPANTNYHIYVYGKLHDARFQMCRAAAEELARDRGHIKCTIEGLFEAQYEQKLRFIVGKYGGSFAQSKPEAPLIFAETDDSVLYFQNEQRFFDWALKRFKYEDPTPTPLITYKEIGSQAVKAKKDQAGRSYCALAFAIGRGPQETVHLELFDEECPILCRNFLDLLVLPKFNGHPVHRVKAGAWLQAGDLVDGSGRHSEAAKGGLLRHESFNIPHDQVGLLGMASHAKDTNGSQFYITTRELPFLDGRSVVFGRVISGMSTVLKISKVETRNERPIEDVLVYSLPEYVAPGRLIQ